MGVSLGWVVVEGKSKEKVQADLQLESTGTFEDVPESGYVGAVLPKGGYLVIGTREDRFVKPAFLRSLSSGCAVTACFVEEHVMFCTSTRWQDGNMIWSATHNGENGGDDLKTEGTLPPELCRVRDRLQAERKTADEDSEDEDDMFDIPIRLAHAVTGYRHDDDIEGAGKMPFEVLKKNSWLKRIFGGK